MTLSLNLNITQLLFLLIHCVIYIYILVVIIPSRILLQMLQSDWLRYLLSIHQYRRYRVAASNTTRQE